MVNPNRFYTYAYLREDKTPYYIGKGTGDRIYRTTGRIINPPKDKSRIIYLKQNLNEVEAFRHEIYMIDVFGRIDLGTGILHNRTDGGDGASGWVPSEETKKNISEAQKGKILSEETRGKMSEGKKGNTNRLGTTHSEETRRKLSEVRKGNTNWLGKTHSEETKTKMCEAHKNPSEETRRKMSEGLKGRTAWNKGKSPSEETKRKRSESVKKWWADKNKTMPKI